VLRVHLLRSAFGVEYLGGHGETAGGDRQAGRDEHVNAAEVELGAGGRGGRFGRRFGGGWLGEARRNGGFGDDDQRRFRGRRFRARPDGQVATCQ